LNALYVGLARSVGLPARHVYGLRIAKSDRGYKMYPQAETPEGRIDPFDPDNFKYEITVKEIN
jgi:transglutaminase-like putative cysteine protease